MLPKKNRADKKAVEKIFKKGFFLGSTVLNLKYITEKVGTPPQISFVVPKTTEKKATKRNYLRRCGYVALNKYFNKIPNGFSGVFIFNKTKDSQNNTKTKSLNKEVVSLSVKLEVEIKSLLMRLNFIKKD